MAQLDGTRGIDRLGRQPPAVISISSSSAPAAPGASSPTACRATPARGCCSSKRAGATTISGSDPGRLPVHHRQPAHRLVLPDRGGRIPRRPLDPLARGRVLGGCSSINAMIYMRGQRADWDHWAALGNRGWGWDDVLPIFRAPRITARRGGWLRRRRRSAHRGPARALGHPRRLPRRGRRDAASPRSRTSTRRQLGLRLLPDQPERGRRWSATKAFLRPVLKRPNLTVLTDAHATRLRLGGRRAHRRRIYARRRGAVAQAGRRNHPRRRRDRLAAAPAALGHRPGAAARAPADPGATSLPGVGENLHDHLQIRMQYTVKNVRTLNTVANSWLGKAAMAAEYFLFRTGPLTMPPSQAGAFAKSDRRSRRRNRMACAAAVARQVRRPAAQLPGDHPERVQPAAELARLGAGQIARPANAPRDTAELPRDRGGPARRGARDALYPPHHGGESAGAVRAARIPAGAIDYE